MKTNKKFPKKAYGAYVSAAIRKLKKSSLSGESLRTAVEALLGHVKNDIVKLPRKVSKSICFILSKHDRVVIVNKGPGRFKVYSMEGYLSMKSTSSLTAQKHKPWEAVRKLKNEVMEISERVAV